jgi:single stranded DNA-binding protein
MAILATQTIVGNIGRVYEAREVGEQKREVIDFTVAVTPRKKVGDDWTDGDTYWVTVTAWGKLAVNVKESFNSGDRVFIIGRTDMKPGYTNKEGVEIAPRPILVADFAGHEISSHPAQTTRKSGGSGGGSYSAPARQSAPRSEAPAAQAKTASRPAASAATADEFTFDLDDEDTPF